MKIQNNWGYDKSAKKKASMNSRRIGEKRGTSYYTTDRCKNERHHQSDFSDGRKITEDLSERIDDLIN